MLGRDSIFSTVPYNLISERLVDSIFATKASLEAQLGRASYPDHFCGTEWKAVP